MMTGEVTEVPLCRVGLAPTLLNGPPGCRAAMGVMVRVLVPWVAITGSQRWPVVMTACS
jgi:hypothetical protein